MAKINFLVLAAFSVLFVLIVNAAEEGINESYNATSEIPDLSYSNDTATNSSYGLNNTETIVDNTETIADNKPIEANNSAENAAQNNLSNANETEIGNNTSDLNDTPQTDNIVLSDALTAENENISIEENQNNANEIAAEASEGLTVDTLTNATDYGGQTDYGEESDASVTASFGVYLEIVG